MVVSGLFITGITKPFVLDSRTRYPFFREVIQLESLTLSNVVMPKVDSNATPVTPGGKQILMTFWYSKAPMSTVPSKGLGFPSKSIVGAFELKPAFITGLEFSNLKLAVNGLILGFTNCGSVPMILGVRTGPKGKDNLSM
jgi:hypothetical protein